MRKIYEMIPMFAADEQNKQKHLNACVRQKLSILFAKFVPVKLLNTLIMFNISALTSAAVSCV